MCPCLSSLGVRWVFSIALVHQVHLGAWGYRESWKYFQNRNLKIKLLQVWGAFSVASDLQHCKSTVAKSCTGRKEKLAAVFKRVKEAGSWGECCTRSQAPAAVPCYRDKHFLSFLAWREGFSCKKRGNYYIPHWYKHIFSSWILTLLLVHKALHEKDVMNTVCDIIFCIGFHEMKEILERFSLPWGGEGEKQQNTGWDTLVTFNILGGFIPFGHPNPALQCVAHQSQIFRWCCRHLRERASWPFCKSDSWERRLNRAKGILWMHQSHAVNKLSFPSRLELFHARWVLPLSLLGWCSGGTLQRCLLGDSRKENNPSKTKTQREVGDHECHALSFIEER